MPRGNADDGILRKTLKLGQLIIAFKDLKQDDL